MGGKPPDVKPNALAEATALLDIKGINYPYANCVCDARTVNVALAVLIIV